MQVFNYSKILKYFETKAKQKKQLYIIPSRKGFRYIFVNFSLFLIAQTYTNNVALLMSFIMVAYFLVEMFGTHKILNKVSINSIQVKSNFLEKNNEVIISGDSLNEYIGHKVDDKNKIKFRAEFKSFKSHEGFFMMNRRGEYKNKILKVYTLGPSKLFYSWKYLKLETHFFVYPKQYESYIIKDLSKSYVKENIEIEYQGHNPYTQRETASRIDWKLYAAKDELYVRDFFIGRKASFEIDYHRLSGEHEQKIEKMSYLISYAFNQKAAWSLKLEAQFFNVDRGQKHYQKCMEAISVLP